MLARRPIAAAGWRGVDDREDKLRRASARAHARRILDAIAAEKLAKVRLFEEGIREQMRLHERLLADRAECLEKLARAEADIGRVRAERDAAAAAVDKRTRKRVERQRPRRPRRLRRKGEKARGAGGGGGGARPPPAARRRPLPLSVRFAYLQVRAGRSRSVRWQGSRSLRIIAWRRCPPCGRGSAAAGTGRQPRPRRRRSGVRKTGYLSISSRNVLIVAEAAVDGGGGRGAWMRAGRPRRATRRTGPARFLRAWRGEVGRGGKRRRTGQPNRPASCIQQREMPAAGSTGKGAPSRPRIMRTAAAAAAPRATRRSPRTDTAPCSWPLASTPLSR